MRSFASQKHISKKTFHFSTLHGFCFKHLRQVTLIFQFNTVIIHTEKFTETWQSSSTPRVIKFLIEKGVVQNQSYYCKKIYFNCLAFESLRRGLPLKSKYFPLGIHINPLHRLNQGIKQTQSILRPSFIRGLIQYCPESTRQDC